jgi:hypothetical protein
MSRKNASKSQVRAVKVHLRENADRSYSRQHEQTEISVAKNGTVVSNKVSIANVVTQIAISGRLEGTRRLAPHKDVVTELVHLGADAAEVEATIESATRRGVITRTGENLVVAR